MTPDRLSILLVGTHPSHAAALRSMIAVASDGAYQIEYIGRANAALGRLRDVSFDVILLGAGDAQLNDQIAALRAQAPCTPLVALPSGGDDTSGLLALQAGAHAHLGRRRLAGHTLLYAIHSAIERGRHASTRPELEIYPRLVDHLPLGVAQIERSGQLRIANPATARMLGIQAGADPSARSFLELFPATDRDYIAGMIERAFAGERMEIEYSSRSCSPAPISSSQSPTTSWRRRGSRPGKS
jgi:DNA-binding NarL/FixJ family response regulator